MSKPKNLVIQTARWITERFQYHKPPNLINTFQYDIPYQIHDYRLHVSHSNTKVMNSTNWIFYIPYQVMITDYIPIGLE